MEREEREKGPLFSMGKMGKDIEGRVDSEGKDEENGCS